MKTLFSNEEISSLSLELSLLFHAGVGTGDALALLAEESAPDCRAALEAMARQVDEGAPLSAAMRDSGRFPAYVHGLVAVGEETGRVEESLTALSRYYEDRVRLARRVRSALLYPAVMLALMLVVIGILLVQVLPIFNDVYASLGGRLTGVAGGLLTLGRWLDSAMPVIWVLLVLLAVGVGLFAGVESFRAKVSALWRRKSGDRGVARKLNTARVAQAMAMGMASGLPLEETLTLAAGLMDETPAAKQRCLDCRSRLESGAGLGAAVQESGLLPASQCRLLELGQRGGAADASMAKISRDLTEDSEAALEDLVSRVEPALVLACSVLVGLILLSVMLPLTHIMAAIG
ncbi:type II secretion system F family protein [uncultured Oscillibacter sp.]|uniref:type II secretion system F family protein n=1 Tax=uncultured Oscillibacter sp. TaxID=876091 RepID=UPI0025FBF6BA|nr:type II secretion system F family protein [uncultured Oscillibacter sp.]